MRVGLGLAVLTALFYVYALQLYIRRVNGLRARNPCAPYDDRLGPTMVAAFSVAALIANTWISLSESASQAGAQHKGSSSHIA